MTTLLLLTRLALATPSYPAALEEAAGMPCQPPCTVCHADNAGGPDTVTQPFGQAMMGEGLGGGGNTPSLQAAFDALAEAGTDSDEDGTSDADALAAGLDPNGGPAFCAQGEPELITPRYGCFSGDGAAAASILGAFGVGTALRRGRRRTRPHAG